MPHTERRSRVEGQGKGSTGRLGAPWWLGMMSCGLGPPLGSHRAGQAGDLSHPHAPDHLRPALGTKAREEGWGNASKPPACSQMQPTVR